MGPTVSTAKLIYWSACAFSGSPARDEMPGGFQKRAGWRLIDVCAIDDNVSTVKCLKRL
jgi:hypothetical protein